jgi:hypothetical protein
MAKGNLAKALMGESMAEGDAEDKDSGKTEDLETETLMQAAKDLIQGIADGDEEAVAAALKASHTACME